MPEALLAAELDRALAGEDAGPEARELAALLVAAAEPARVDVSPDELERALTVARPARRPAHRRRLVLAFAFAVVAAALAALFLRTPSDDVEAKAARAVDGAFFVVEETRPARAGLFEPTTSTGYVDPQNGRSHWRVTSGGDLVSETAVTPSRVQRYDAADNTLTVASSCRSFASGCADVLDPLDLYRRALADGSTRVERAGDDWLLTIRGAGDVEQLATVDGTTYLPSRPCGSRSWSAWRLPPTRTSRSTRTQAPACASCRKQAPGSASSPSRRRRCRRAPTGSAPSTAASPRGRRR
jgi:hypothetical protein